MKAGLAFGRLDHEVFQLQAGAAGFGGLLLRWRRGLSALRWEGCGLDWVSSVAPGCVTGSGCRSVVADGAPVGMPARSSGALPKIFLSALSTVFSSSNWERIARQCNARRKPGEASRPGGRPARWHRSTKAGVARRAACHDCRTPGLRSMRRVSQGVRRARRRCHGFPPAVPHGPSGNRAVAATPAPCRA